MNYFVVEITVLQDGNTASAVTPKPNFREALMLYHSVMASALANSNVVHCTCVILDEGGNLQDVSKNYDGELV